MKNLPVMPKRPPAWVPDAALRAAYTMGKVEEILRIDPASCQRLDDIAHERAAIRPLSRYKSRLLFRARAGRGSPFGRYFYAFCCSANLARIIFSSRLEQDLMV